MQPVKQRAMKFSSYLLAIVFAAITFGLWAWLNKPVDEPHWPDRVQGMAFSPFNAEQDPVDRTLPSREQIDADLSLLASARVNSVRTYSTLDTLADVPELADKHQLKVAIGAWLDTRRATNEKEIVAAIDLAQKHANVIRVVIGNEAVLRGDLTAEELGTQLKRVRDAVDQPVSTAEPWHVWITHPELAEHVDFIGVHLLPYWEGIPVDMAVDYLASRVQLLEKTFPGKPVVICEVGWPSEGRTRDGAVASVSNEALFLRRFLARARDEGYVYYIMEAFDQPWKARYEGAVGAYWGVYNVQRQPKFEFVKPIVRIPQWQMLAGISVVTAAILLLLVYTNTHAMGTRGRSFLATVIYASATCAVLVIYRYSQQYLTLTSLVVGTLLILGMLGVIAVVVSEAIEWAEARWGRERRRLLPEHMAPPDAWPKVSIHVPAYNEPAAMLVETLEALARLDYPDFEVLVIDNNTPDEHTWRPVETKCRELGPRFRFFHVAPLAGFKAGALNYALERTDPDARIVAVIDSDYKVDSRWLKDLVPAFANERIAIVQAPQDYRDHDESAFKAMCYAEYRGFFFIGMVTRNERNAIIQHGTMTLVQRAALQKHGGWAEWCITEDAELGLRLFEQGYEAFYQPRSYGRGLMPGSFSDYKRQRFRWAYGAMQILRRHATALFSKSTQLTAGQRYHFIAGWLPWLADGLNLVVNVAAIGWSIAMIHAPHRIDPPLVMFSILPLALFTFKLVKLAHLYVSRIGANLRQTAAAALAGLALSHTIGLAVVKGLITRNEPFFRTPKGGSPRTLTRALAGAAQEIVFLIALLASVYLLTNQVVIGGESIGLPAELRGPDVAVWVAVLLIQAVPYAAALIVSLVSETQLPARLLGSAPGTQVEPLSH